MMRARYVNCAGRNLMVAVLAVAATVPALGQDKLEESFTEGKVHFNLRYRYEFVDQDAFTLNANANTIRLRLGYTTKAYHGFFGTTEYQGFKRCPSRGKYASSEAYLSEEYLPAVTKRLFKTPIPTAFPPLVPMLPVWGLLALVLFAIAVKAAPAWQRSRS